MTEIIVHKGLKPKYWLRALWWKIVVRSVFVSYANVWKKHPLVHYPLMIDIELGTMRLYYLKHGFYYVFKRINTYNKVIVSRMSGDIEEISIEFFQRKVKLSNASSVEKQLEKEMKELEYY